MILLKIILCCLIGVNLALFYIVAMRRKDSLLFKQMMNNFSDP